MQCADASPTAHFLIPEACHNMQMINCSMRTIAGTREPVPASDEERFMLLALRLAERGRRTSSPNPAVGAVVVNGGLIVGQGFHEKPGAPHAEINALVQAGVRAHGADVFVTLEPCAHHGRTPPCVDSLIEAGVGRVVLATRDPNPMVSGKGVDALRSAGVEVIEGPYGEIANRLNQGYMKWITTGSPFVTLKMAMTLDGKVATASGDARWISCDVSRLDVHEERAVSDAVMVGLGTVRADDPRLTAREVGAPGQPLRVIVDGAAEVPPESKVLDTSEAPTALAVGSGADMLRIEGMVERGVEVITAGEGIRVDLELLMQRLGHREITTVYVEGGPTLAAGLFEAKLVDRVVMYVAPKVVGDLRAPGPLAGSGPALMSGATPLCIDSVWEMGRDIKVVAYPAGRMQCSQG